LTVGGSAAPIVVDMDEKASIEKPRITALAPWFGGKRTLAPAIVQELGPHTQYFEPFCGAMSVLFAKPPSQKETVNDLHGDLVNLARVVQEEAVAARLYDRLQRVLVCEALLEDARARLQSPPEDPLERAYWYFLASWAGRGGTAGTERLDYQIAVRWTCRGGSPTVRWQNAVESLPAWHRRLRGVVILCRDAFEILDRFEDAPETAIYADPPYAPETRTGAPGSKAGGSGRYLHEFNHRPQDLLGSPDDHGRLRDLLAAYRRARIVVSAYDCPRYRDLYAGWTFVEHYRLKSLHAQNVRGQTSLGRGDPHAEGPEVLILNGPSLVAAEQPVVLEGPNDA